MKLAIGKRKIKFDFRITHLTFRKCHGGVNVNIGRDKPLFFPAIDDEAVFNVAGFFAICEGIRRAYIDGAAVITITYDPKEEYAKYASKVREWRYEDY